MFVVFFFGGFVVKKRQQQAITFFFFSLIEKKMTIHYCHHFLLWVFCYKEGDDSYNCRRFLVFFFLFEKKIMTICRRLFCGCFVAKKVMTSLCLRRRRQRPFFFSSPFVAKKVSLELTINNDFVVFKNV
jgi:hypothetical protein